MRKRTKLYVLLGVLLIICIAAFAVSRYEEKKEQIKNSGEVILEIPTDSVTSLSWTNENGTFSFTKDEAWTYDDDAAFPVDESKINELLAQFESFAAAFAIDDVDDYSQYGLDDPVCTINISAGEKSYTVKLGDFSKMDQQRYISIDDGKAYLVSHDPLDEFNAVLSDMILNDTIPQFDTAEQITFSGSESYTVTLDESGKSICKDDIYFTDGKPLDTDNVNVLLGEVKSLSLTDYVSYNVSDEELEAFGLDDPDLNIEIKYSIQNDDGSTENSGTLLLSASRDPEEATAYEKAVENDEDELPNVSCYVRIGQSQIVYKITQSEYDVLTDVSYDTLRHQKLFTADFDTVTSIDISLNGESYTFGYTPPKGRADEDDEGTWTYNGREFDVTDLKVALTSVSASGFTDNTSTGQEEISLVLHLDNNDFPTLKLTFYRYDGTKCLVAVDGEPTAFVPRSQTVDLIEAVNELTLGS